MESEKVAYIPLGMNCAVAHTLNHRGLRAEAFPFDWNITPPASALEMIGNGFERFLDPRHLCYLPPAQRMLFSENGVDLKVSEELITPVVCTRYGCLYPHDFSVAGREDYRLVRERYARRIERLMSVIASGVRKVFIFAEQELNEWQDRQYWSCGLPFRKSASNRVAAMFHDLAIPNAELVSLEQFTARPPR